jgi:hypothetical protein
MAAISEEKALGAFDDSGDIGAVQIPGSAHVDGDRLVVTGSGHNMWFEDDECHFVWKKVEGDWSVGALVHFVGEGANAHRKAVALVRASLDSDAAYAGIALHAGDGLTSLQYREAKGRTTEEIRFDVNAPSRIALRKVGDRVEVSADGAERHEVTLAFEGSYYIGLAVCSHVDDVAETVEFSEVSIQPVAG